MTLALLLRRFAGLPPTASPPAATAGTTPGAAAPKAAAADPRAATAAAPSAAVARQAGAGSPGPAAAKPAGTLPARVPQAPPSVAVLVQRLLANPVWRGPTIRLRLVDAVAVAAAGLLLLKVLALLEAGPSTGARFAEFLVHARSGYEPLDPTITGSLSPKEAAPAPASPQPEAPRPAPEPASSSERAILEKLGARRDALQQRSRDLETREQLIENAERKLETRINDLKTLEQKGDDAAAKRAEAEAAGLKSLVTMYETMKPKEAARVFDRLKLEVLVPVVVGMNPRKMAEVLAVMQPEAAERLTVALAQRARGAGGPKAAAIAPGLPPGELPAIDGAR
ncbi:Flagellar motility protein MotE, a chaperone for MotC folding [Methylobacterium sp. 174MFSha1.1]|uniref:MotE family protein n=1 Tax=Methylobacterium sp. 174MFSha1.1 TaxID=1502749 RepID=UPI0008F43704|nr:Flagellar motility protein MotE, a chaperone for MotC folding [Methylobacterium sp. 174MFSha1.1]